MGFANPTLFWDSPLDRAYESHDATIILTSPFKLFLISSVQTSCSLFAFLFAFYQGALSIVLLLERVRSGSRSRTARTSKAPSEASIPNCSGIWTGRSYTKKKWIDPSLFITHELKATERGSSFWKSFTIKPCSAPKWPWTSTASGLLPLVAYQSL